MTTAPGPLPPVSRVSRLRRVRRVRRPPSPALTNPTGNPLSVHSIHMVLFSSLARHSLYNLLLIYF